MTKEKAAADKQRQKEEYLDHKKALLKMEEQNYTKLYLIKTFDGWYKLFGHSALFLSRHLSDRVGRVYNLNPDQDYGVRDKIGSVSIPEKKLDEFRLRMDRAKIKLVNEWGMGLEFEFGETLTEEDVVRMQHEEELVIAHANELVMPHVVMPELRARVRNMAEIIHEAVTHQSKMARTTFLNDFEIKAAEINMMVIGMSRGAIEIDECLNRVLEATEIMYEYATTMADYQMMSAKKYFNMVKKIRAVEDQVKREMKNQALKKVEQVTEKGKRRKTTDVGKNNQRNRTPGADPGSEEIGDVDSSVPTAEEEKTE